MAACIAGGLLTLLPFEVERGGEGGGGNLGSDHHHNVPHWPHHCRLWCNACSTFMGSCYYYHRSRSGLKRTFSRHTLRPHTHTRAHCNDAPCPSMTSRTLQACAMGLMLIPMDLLSSLGFSCSIVVVCTMLINLTLTPALLLWNPCNLFVRELILLTRGHWWSRCTPSVCSRGVALYCCGFYADVRNTDDS